MPQTEAEIVAQLNAAHDKYRTGATGMAVQDDQDARETAIDAAKTAITNAQFSTVTGTEAPGDRVTGKVYAGGNQVTAVNATFMEASVVTALAADEGMSHGGPYTADYSLASPYVDGLTLIQGSLLTGEKFF